MSNEQFQCGPVGATPVELYGPEDGGWYTTRVHDWIGLCTDLRDPDVRGYLVLRALVVEKYKNPIRKLTLAVLCELIPGPNKKPSSLTRVRGILAGLSGVGLISTPEGGPVKTSSRAGASQRTIRIRINDMPPEGYAGWRNAEAKLSCINRTEAEKKAGRNSDPGTGADQPGEGPGRNSDPPGSNSDPRGSNCDPVLASEQPEHGVPLVPSFGTATGGDALAARSAGDARRASDGSNAREAEGGCAASSKNQPSPTQHNDKQPAVTKKPSSKKAVHTAAELKTVRAVRAFFPADLLSGWANPETGQQIGELPDVPSLSQAILDALAGDAPGAERTVDQLGARVQQRWNHHGWASKFYAGEIDSLVGAAVAMVRPLKAGDRYGCANPRCEAGADVDTGEGCTVCPERIAVRKAKRARQGAQGDAGGANSASSGPGSGGAVMPPQRGSRDFSRGAECDGRDGMCGNPTAPGSDLCWRCAAENVNQGIPAPF